MSFSPAVLQNLPSLCLHSPWLFGKELVLWDPDGNTMEANELFHFPYVSHYQRNGKLALKIFFKRE